MTAPISYDDFARVDIRVGRIIEVTDFERARNPSYKLRIDFGPEIGVKQSSAQFRTNYPPEQLLKSRLLMELHVQSPGELGFGRGGYELGVEAAG